MFCIGRNYPYTKHHRKTVTCYRPSVESSSRMPCYTQAARTPYITVPQQSSRDPQAFFYRSACATPPLCWTPLCMDTLLSIPRNQSHIRDNTKTPPVEKGALRHAGIKGTKLVSSRLQNLGCFATAHWCNGAPFHFILLLPYIGFSG